MQTAEVIAIGSELLGSTRLDTNSLYLAERLASLGIELRSKTVVGDSRREVAEHLRRALDRADLVILTGGLGPTDDDVTRDALADVLGLPLIEHPDIVERLGSALRAGASRCLTSIAARRWSSRAAWSSRIRMAPHRDRWSRSVIGS